MNKRPTVSIVMPVYNVENYIYKCIKSIIAQTYTDWELIIVNDGSTDKSISICQRLVNSYPIKMKIVNKDNGGLSDARNYGTAMAKGEYLVYIDSDDVVSPRFLEVLLSGIKNNKADISTCMYKDIPEQDVNLISNSHIIEEGSISNVDAIKRLLKDNNINTGAWGKLAKTEFWKNYKFPKGRIYEDLSTIYKLITDAKIVFFTNEILYGHVIRDGSLSHQKTVSDSQISDYLLGIDERFDYLSASFPSLSKLLYANRAVELLRVYCLVMSSACMNEYKKKVLKDIEVYVKNNFKNVLLCGSAKMIMKCVTFLFSKSLYIVVVNRHENNKHNTKLR